MRGSTALHAGWVSGAQQVVEVGRGDPQPTVGGLQEDLADRCLDLWEERHTPTDHVFDQLGRGQIRRGRGDDVPAVAKYGRPVGQGEDLVQAMAHEQDRNAPLAQPADDREQAIDLVGRQRGRRLVEDQQAGLDRQRLGDLDQLLVGHRQAPHRCADIEPDVELLEQSLGRPARRARRGTWQC